MFKYDTHLLVWRTFLASWPTRLQLSFNAIDSQDHRVLLHLVFVGTTNKSEFRTQKSNDRTKADELALTVISIAMPHKVVVELMGRAIPLLNAIPIDDAGIRGRMQRGGLIRFIRWWLLVQVEAC